MRVLAIGMLLLIATGCRPTMSLEIKEVDQPDAVADSTDSTDSDETTATTDEIAEAPAEETALPLVFPPTETTEKKMTVPDESSLDEVLKMVQDGSAILVDVRSDEEWNEKHFDAAKHIPIDKITEDAAKALEGVKKDQLVFLH